MRLLIATGLYPPEIGGPATYAQLLEERLPALGIEVDVVPFSIVRRFPPILRHVLYAIILMRQARGKDLLLVQDTVSTGVPAAITSIIQRIPLVLRVPGDYAWEQGVQRFGVNESLDEFQKRRYGIRVEILRALQRFVARRAHRIIAPSEYLSNIIRAWTSTTLPITVNYNGIQIPNSIGGEREASLIVSSGRLVPWKGFPELIDVVIRHSDWRLEILGDGPDRKILQDQVQKNSAETRVRLCGNVSHMDARIMFARASVFVLNSTYEGLSHTLIEAMSTGAPVIATRVGGNPEVIQDGVNGILIEAGDQVGLEKALVRLMSDSALRSRMGSAGKDRAKDFSVDKTIEATASLLKSCVSSR